MYIFSAWLKHWVAPYKSDCTRISVSGNFHDSAPLNNIIEFAPEHMKAREKMTNWDELNYNYFNSIEVIPYDVPEKEFKWLKKEIEKAKKEKIKANAGLVVHIKEEYNLKRVTSSFENFLIEKINHPAFDSWKKNGYIIRT